ncbi:MAG: hypothetical protein ABW208_08885 [Pyrinomonadaceae bacterium]
MSAKRKDEPDIEPPAASRLRLIKTTEAKRPEPSPELKAILDDMRRRYRVGRERSERDPGGKDAA